MKKALLANDTSSGTNDQKQSAVSFLYKTFSVYKRRIHYWKLTRAYSSLLRSAYSEFVFVKNDGFRSHTFQTSIEYGSIESMDNRDVDNDNEEKEIIELQLQLKSENSNAPVLIPTPTDLVESLDPSQGFDILDIDTLLAAQSAAEAIQVSLSTSNDGWWNDLFGEEPANMDYDMLVQQYNGSEMFAP